MPRGVMIYEYIVFAMAEGHPCQNGTPSLNSSPEKLYMAFLSVFKYFLELNYPEKLTHGKDYQCLKNIKVRPPSLTLSLHRPQRINTQKPTLLTNEKKGGLEVVAFDRSPFKLFTQRFSNELVQVPSSERPKTTQRTLFLSFEVSL
jgi:hypothetical protein